MTVVQLVHFRTLDEEEVKCMLLMCYTSQYARNLARNVLLKTSELENNINITAQILITIMIEHFLNVVHDPYYYVFVYRFICLCQHQVLGPGHLSRCFTLIDKKIDTNPHRFPDISSNLNAQELTSTYWSQKPTTV